ncbi:IclR family transcriptional regulator [Pseudonocardia sp. KRD291]|uniref:IclR family transcriptional regulator n=1 Tax=Pseudonocardia sp. KRD291 TaxID=2792007 RepID=UPI001C49F617|nr:IclR family transcriptional regulator C-terminal domain-containing protein [Pseudonocardia sp. KRD291]MBW0101139.1 IclR family transcriptional regulator [Pseudonocardia sp. KRD291]
MASLLDVVVGRPGGVTLTGLAHAVDAPVSSVQKLVDGLTAVGFLDEHDRRYSLGPAPYVLALRAGLPPVQSVRHARLAALSERLGVPVLLAVRVGDDAVYVDWAGADEAFDVAISAQVRRPLLDTAAGRVLFAHLPEAARREIALAAHADAPAAVVAVLDDAAAVRERGAETGHSGPLLPGATAVAVPVYRDGQVVAAVSAADRRGVLGGRWDATATTLADAVRDIQE